MKLEFVQLCQFPQSIFRSEGPVGIYTEFDVGSGKMTADVGQQFQFTLKFDSSDFYLDAPESGFHLFFNATVHLVKIAHPDESVDGNALCAPAEGSIPKSQAMGLQVGKGRFQSERMDG